MNENPIANSRKTQRLPEPLPLIRLNRRFAVTCALCLCALQLALAESREASQIKDSTPPLLQAEFIRPSAVALPDEIVYRHITEAAATRSVNFTRPKNKARTSLERWQKFEAEFGIREPEPSPVLSAAQLAKYNLDRVTFAVDDFTRSLSDATQFEFGGGRIHRAHSVGNRSELRIPDGSLQLAQNARLGLDINLDRGRPYLGFKCEIPFGE